jgi:hypothetical protein
MDPFIPEDVYRFIEEKIDSIAQLEGMLLFRSNPEKDWDAKMLSERLYISSEEAKALVGYMRGTGYIEERKWQPGFYYYAPASPALAALLEKTADTYSRYLVPVTRLIHLKSRNRIQEFANAFRVRKDRNDS